MNIAVEEVESIGLIAFDGEAVPAEIEFREAGQVILVLGFLRAVLEVAVVDGLSPAHVVDANDHGVHTGERALALEGQARKGETDDGEHEDCHLQIGVHNERVAILFQVAFGGSCDLRCCLGLGTHIRPRFSGIVISRRVTPSSPCRVHYCRHRCGR